MGAGPLAAGPAAEPERPPPVVVLARKWSALVRWKSRRSRKREGVASSWALVEEAPIITAVHRLATVGDVLRSGQIRENLEEIERIQAHPIGTAVAPSGLTGEHPWDSRLGFRHWQSLRRSARRPRLRM